MPINEREPIDGELENDDFREEMSPTEREAEGGMRATELGHLGDQRVQDLVDEVDDLEGHNSIGAGSRERISTDAGFEGDMAPEGWTGADLDRRRRKAKSAETDHHPPAEYYRDSEKA